MANSLSNGTIRRVCTSLGSVPSGNEVLGSLGQLGGFQLGADGVIASSSGDVTAIPDPGGAIGTYRILFPNINGNIQTISWFEVAGFTPRNPTTTETACALVTGYNQDATTLQWYITVQIAGITSGAWLGGTPSNIPTGFVVGCRAAFVFTPQANRQ